jgi:ABC-type antimicrobial peptide transport system permease subunit
MKQGLRQFFIYPVQSWLIVAAIALGVSVITAVYTVLASSTPEEALWQRELTLQDVRTAPKSLPVPLREISDVSETNLVFSDAELTMVKDAVPALNYAYIKMPWQKNVVLGDDVVNNTEVMYVSQDYLKAAELSLVQGSLPTERDFIEKQPVIVLASDVARRLRDDSLIGKEVILENIDGTRDIFTVIGILQSKVSQTSIIPYGSTSMNIPLRTLTFAMTKQAEIDDVLEPLSVFVRKTWGGRAVVTTIRSNRGAERLISLVIVTFASTALLAASLNIMNLLLARVLRHTHDIGVQRAIGASRQDIVRRFLAEALVLGCSGGLLGVLLSYGLVNLYLNYISSLGEQLSFSSLFSWHSVVLGLTLSVISTFIFGLYPAFRASRLPIVEALNANH